MPDATPTPLDAPAPSPDPDAAETLRAEVDALAGTPADAGAAATAQIDDAADLARQIEQILAEESLRAQAGAEPSAPHAPSDAAPTPEPGATASPGLPTSDDTTQSAASLEAEIDALIAGASPPAPTPAPTVAPAQPEPIAPPQAVAATPPATPPAPSAAADPTPAPSVDPPAAHAAHPSPPAPAPVPPPSAARVVVEEVRPPRSVPGLVAILGRPLAGKPPIVRGAVALVGMNTLVLAAFVWAFVLFLRPTPQEVRAGAFDFQGGAVPRVPDAPPRDVTPLDGHAKDAHAKDTHAQPKKPSKPSGKGEKHGGGGH